MKKKKILIPLLLLLLAGGGFWWYAAHRQPAVTVSPTAFVPPGSVYILQTDDAYKAWNEIHRHPLWQATGQVPSYAFLQELDSLLHYYITENKTTRRFFKKRPFVMSAHLVRQNDYDFLYLIDLKKNYPAGQIIRWLKPFLPRQVTIKSLRINGHPAWKVSGWTDEPFYFSLRDNILLVSFSYQIIRQSLYTPANRSLDNFFDEYTSSGLIHFYFDYNKLPAFIATFGIKPGKTVYTLSHELEKSLLDVDLGHPVSQATGITIADSSAQIIPLLGHKKPPQSRVWRILPASTILYTSLSVDDFTRFYQQLLTNMRQTRPGSTDTYLYYKQQLKKFFGIDLEKDLLSWMGPELGLAKWGDPLAPTAALLIQTRNPEEARRHLENVNRLLRKRSPVHFKSFDYEGYTIAYLHQKNFFKWLFGSWLNEITTPYYVWMDDYVIFSNSARDLEQLIDARIQGQTLAGLRSFEKVRKQISGGSHFRFMVKPPALYDGAYRLASPADRQQLSEYYPLMHQIDFLVADWTIDNEREVETRLVVETAGTGKPRTESK